MTGVHEHERNERKMISSQHNVLALRQLRSGDERIRPHGSDAATQIHAEVGVLEPVVTKHLAANTALHS